MIQRRAAHAEARGEHVDYQWPNRYFIEYLVGREEVWRHSLLNLVQVGRLVSELLDGRNLTVHRIVDLRP